MRVLTACLPAWWCCGGGQVGPGQVSSYVLFSSSIAQPFAFNRRRLALLADLQANSPASLAALLAETRARGLAQALQGGGASMHSYDLPPGNQGFALAVCNSGGSSEGGKKAALGRGMVLEQELTFELDGMQLWTLKPDGQATATPPPKATDRGGGRATKTTVALRLKPGQAQLLVLRPTEEGQLSGYSFGYEFSYSYVPLQGAEGAT